MASLSDCAPGIELARVPTAICGEPQRAWAHHGHREGNSREGVSGHEPNCT